MKKRIPSILLIVLTIIFFLPGISQQYLNQIVERGELRVGMSATQPPFCMTDSSGQFVGYEVELAEMLAAGMGVRLKIVQIPFGDLLSSLEKERIDMVMSGMTITMQRNMKSVFVGPHMISGKSILTRSALFAQTNDSEDINDQSVKIGVLRGSTSETYVKNEIPEASLTLCTDYDECIQLLENGKINIMVADYPICAYTAQVYPEKGLITVDQPLTIEPIGIALPPDASHFINVVENFLNGLLLSGILDNMQLYWFDSGEWVEKVQ
jgi:polar amino acid transport system substrate-binding protein